MFTVDSSVAIAVLLAGAGLVVGPWLGIAVDRAVERLPPRPEHRCTTCQTALGPVSLIPVRSWWDHCPSCRNHKGRRYPAVDVSVALVWAMLGLRFDAGPVLASYLALGAVLVVLSAIDIETHLLPNVIVWPSFFFGLLIVLVVSGQRGYFEGIGSAILGAVVFTGFIGGAHLAYARGMGFGDVKLSLTLGLFVGWLQPSLVEATRLVLITIVLALLGGGLTGLAVNAIRRRSGAEIPFGPALAAATMATVVASAGLTGTSLG